MAEWSDNVERKAAQLGPYKLPVKHTEHYSGEVREWVEEIVIPSGHWLIKDILTDLEKVK